MLSPRERWRVWFVNMGGQGKGEKELSKRILPSWRFFNSFDSAPQKIFPQFFYLFYPGSSISKTPSKTGRVEILFPEIKFENIDLPCARQRRNPLFKRKIRKA